MTRCGKSFLAATVALLALGAGSGAQVRAQSQPQPGQLQAAQAQAAQAQAGQTQTGQNAPTADASQPSTDASKSNADVAEPKAERILLKPGKSLSINMATEDIICTNDVELARKQKESYPDSPEAGFIYAVALSRTSRVEDALKEVRRARRLAEKQGGPAYFDKMIETYENMLTYCPEDNQVRYHLAWAYYMKAYVLAKYSNSAGYKDWVAQANKPPEKAPEQVAAAETTQGAAQAPAQAPDAGATTVTLNDIHTASSTISGASLQAKPQVQKYYQLAIAKLDDLLGRDPTDTWARVYRAFLKVEAGGDLQVAMAEWQKVRDEAPNNPAAYFFLGEGYLKQGNLKESLFNVSKAVALRAVGN